MEHMTNLDSLVNKLFNSSSGMSPTERAMAIRYLPQKTETIKRYFKWTTGSFLAGTVVWPLLSTNSPLGWIDSAVLLGMGSASILLGARIQEYESYLGQAGAARQELVRATIGEIALTPRAKAEAEKLKVDYSN